jgi:sporulation protein YlmC with PRC-barrel domain
MRTTLQLALAAFAFAAVAAIANVAAAQDPAKANQANVAIAQVFRSGEIIGMPVKNNSHETLGHINDLVVDMKTGEVRYAALSFGGVAGIGSKLFAVPFGSMKFMFGEPKDANSRHFMFDATKEQLERAPGFDTSTWPNVGDAKWAASIDKHYNYERKHTDSGATVTYETVFRASKVKGMDVRNSANENLGSVDELVIDVTKGHVKYVALSYGSWFTGGNKLFAAPLSSLTLTHANDKTFFVAHVSQDTLKNAPGFDKNNWPNTADPNWAKGIDTYYQRSAQRPATRQ